jgi:hypothetical protein
MMSVSQITGRHWGQRYAVVGFVAEEEVEEGVCSPVPDGVVGARPTIVPCASRMAQRAWSHAFASWGRRGAIEVRVVENARSGGRESRIR